MRKTDFMPVKKDVIWPDVYGLHICLKKIRE
mgnify:CR=1 FL=1